MLDLSLFWKLFLLIKSYDLSHMHITKSILLLIVMFKSPFKYFMISLHLSLIKWDDRAKWFIWEPPMIFECRSSLGYPFGASQRYLLIDILMIEVFFNRYMHLQVLDEFYIDSYWMFIVGQICITLLDISLQHLAYHLSFVEFKYSFGDFMNWWT